MFKNALPNHNLSKMFESVDAFDRACATCLVVYGSAMNTQYLEDWDERLAGKSHENCLVTNMGLFAGILTHL